MRRLVHLGVGNFARAHTLVATQQAGGWEVAVFTGRSPAMAEALNSQSGKYGLVVRGPERDEVEIIDVIDEAGAAQHLHTWIKHSPVLKPGSIMPRYDGGDDMVNGKTQKGGTLTDAEIDDISAYLRSLKLPEEADYWRDTPVINTLNGGTQ